MRYLNQKGDSVSEADFIEQENKIKSFPDITGWCIDIGNADLAECEEFLRLYKKIKPIPLYNNKNEKSNQ